MEMAFSDLKVVLVHDWLTGMRGGEKVLEELCDLYPRADIFTLLHNPGSVSSKIESHRIHTSFINKLPLKKTKYRSYLPLFPTAIELFNFKGYDLILSTSHCVAKGLITPPDSLHISYLHTPMRYVWDMYDEYFGPGQVGRISGRLIPLFANYLRMWDVTSSNRVDWYLANSGHVASRIRKYYRREATVIHPPVNTDLFGPAEESKDYFLIVSALVPYKKVDLAVAAFNQMKRRLLIVGSGPERARLQKMAGPTIDFLDWQPADRLREFYSDCRALIFPGEEDFGIVPVEAMACGKPVLAFKKGGALETVKEGETGLFFRKQTVEDMIDAVRRFEEREWNAKAIAVHAGQFSKVHFKKKISEFIQEKVESFLGSGKSSG